MRENEFVRRGGWVVVGACLGLVFAACATTNRPEPAARPESNAKPAPAAAPLASGGAAATGEATADDVVLVTGNRIGREDLSASRDRLFEEPARPAVAAGAGTRSASVYPAQAFEDRSAATPGAAAFGAGAARTARDASVLSRISPGEELWIISQPPAEAGAKPAVAEDALGSGVMIARVSPTGVGEDIDLPAPPTREIPLPLKHTDVDAHVQGYVGTVDVTQQFENPYDEKIEAVYMFPLPEKAAVSEFVMTIGDRHIRGILREKHEAEQVYRQARAQGYQASLLTQHRPNVFEQKVANIEPGREIDVAIRYYETLAYRDGWYSFVFPTVVGPRYNPPGAADPVLAVPQSDHAPIPGTAVRYLTPGTRSAHDLSIAVELDPGVAIEEVESSHEITQTRLAGGSVRVALADGAALPNRDFRLDFRVAGDTIKSNLLTYVDAESGQGYFTLMMYPPAGLERLERQPLELVFVLDCSGSMSGAPIEQAKAAVLAALDRLEPGDTFQIIRFSESASQFGPEPVPATAENIRAARAYVGRLAGAGGTRMIEGIRAALDFPHDDARLRFVTFLTDGFIGNEAEILGALDARLGASRIFSFGVGSAPNRYLLERMAAMGRGAVAYLSLRDSGRVVMDAFFDRIAHPAMIDVAVDWGGMRVADVYPRRLPDLFVGRPVVVTGRFKGKPQALRLTGRAGPQPIEVDLAVEPGAPDYAFLPNLWARLRIADLNDRLVAEPDSAGLLAQQIRETALAYQLMSAYTSFVAVDASRVTGGGSWHDGFSGRARARGRALRHDRRPLILAQVGQHALRRCASAVPARRRAAG